MSELLLVVPHYIALVVRELIGNLDNDLVSLHHKEKKPVKSPRDRWSFPCTVLLEEGEFFQQVFQSYIWTKTGIFKSGI